MIAAGNLRFPVRPAMARTGAGYTPPRVVPAWHVIVEWQRIGGPSFPTPHDENRTFRSLAAAMAYAHAKTGPPSHLVPSVYRRGTIVQGARDADWVDTLRRIAGLRPSWRLHVEDVTGDGTGDTDPDADHDASRPHSPAHPFGNPPGSRRAVLAFKLAAQRAYSGAAVHVEG